MSQPAPTATLWDHLEEARGGILRSGAYLLGGTLVAAAGYQQLFAALRWPALRASEIAGLDNFVFRIFEPAGGVWVVMQAALVAGTLLSCPLWLAEAARYVLPGLYPHERRSLLLILPIAVLLFIGGALFCYLLSPVALAFLFRLNESLGVDPELALGSYLRFMLRLLLVFGFAFELPLVLMFLTYCGLATSRRLWQSWRGAVVVIMIIAAVATPTTDPLTMTLMALPLVALYFVSIGLAKLVERRRAQPAEGDGITHGG